MFGDALAQALSDDDGDGIWSVTLEVDSGFTGYYIFLNSPNNGLDWGAKKAWRAGRVLIQAIMTTGVCLLSRETRPLTFASAVALHVFQTLCSGTQIPMRQLQRGRKYGRWFVLVLRDVQR